jgi:hypothetical protein
MQPDDVVADEDMHYESDENREPKSKEKPVGPPLDLVVPFRQPPARPDKVSYHHVMRIHLSHIYDGLTTYCCFLFLMRHVHVVHRQKINYLVAVIYVKYDNLASIFSFKLFMLG